MRSKNIENNSRMEDKRLKKYSPAISILEVDQYQTQKEQQYANISSLKNQIYTPLTSRETPLFTNNKYTFYPNSSQTSFISKNDSQLFSQSTDYHPHHQDYDQNSLKTQIILLNKQNRLLSEDYSKMKKSYFIQKQKVKQWQIWNEVSGKMLLKSIKQLIEQKDYNKICLYIETQLNIHLVKNIFPKQYCEEILQVLRQAPQSIDQSLVNLKQQMTQQVSSLMKLNVNSAERAERKLQSMQRQMQKKLKQISNLKYCFQQKQKSLQQKCIQIKKIKQENASLKKQMLQMKQVLSIKELQIKKIKESCKQIQKKQTELQNVSFTLKSKNTEKSNLFKAFQSQKNAQAQFKQLTQKFTNQIAKFEQKLQKVQNQWRIKMQQRNKTIQLQLIQISALKQNKQQLKPDIRLSSMINHLWQIKQIQFMNIKQILDRK